MNPRSCHDKLQSVGITLYFAAGLATTSAALPSVRPLANAKWPGGPRGSLYDVALSGHFAYVALGTSGLGVIDVSDPTNAVHVGSDTTAGGAYRLAVAGRYLYVAGRGSGLHIVDISNPIRPARVGGVDGFNAADVKVSENHAYVANSLAGLEVFDVSPS